MQGKWAMNILTRLKVNLERTGPNDLLLVDADYDDWYAILGYLESYPEYKNRVLMLSRFHDEFVIIPENSMKLIGWHHE